MFIKEYKKSKSTMKKIIYIVLLVFISSTSISAAAQKFTIFEGDTLNLIDENNLKQGFWKIFGKMKKDPDYEPDQVVEQGNFSNSRKQGLWKKFFPNGKTKSEIEYVNHRPKGFYKTFYENGQVEEEGNWVSNRNTGKFVRHHPNGQISQEFNFNESGKRDGTQIYRNEEGVAILVAEIRNGKEEKVVSYYDDGSLKAEKAFINGNIDLENTKTYESKTPISKPKEDEGKEEVVTVDIKKEKVNNQSKVSFTGEGEHKIYNSDKQISKDGFFKRYRLMDGKHFIYNENGILVNIKLFKKGRYIGDAPLPED